MPSYESFAASSTSHVTPPQPQITGQDTDKEINDGPSTANTQTTDDHNTKADAETKDDVNTKAQTADDHNTKADPETNDGGK
jgi:hypothetical protein